ncbi:MAG: tetratricopeptide repeat protein [Lachnospirales bacterium]
MYNNGILQLYDDPDKAIKLANDLYNQKPTNKTMQAKAMLLTSTAYSSKRDFEKSLVYALKAREINESTKDPILQIHILSKIAAQYHQLGVTDKALEVLDEADKIAGSNLENDSVRSVMGNNYGIKGFIYTDQLSCDLAITYFDKSIQTYSSLKQTKRILANKSVVTYNKGNCLISLNRLYEAESIFKQANTFAQKAGANSLQAFSLKGLAEVYTLKRKHKEALDELQKANELAKNVGDLVLNREIYIGMADNYLALNDWDNYQIYNDKSGKTAQQIITSERKTINNLLNDYSMEIEQKITKLKWVYGSIIFLTLVFIFLLVFYLIKGEISFQKKLKKVKSQIKF